MAVAVTTLTQSERDLAAADKPILAATPDADNFIDANSGWDVGTITGTSATAVDTDANKPIRRAVDGLPGLRTAPNATGTLHTMVLNFSPGITFDFIGYLGHNFRTRQVTDLTLQVADDGAFTTNVRTLSSRNIFALFGSDRRVADLTLIDTGIDAQRFSGVEWIRLQFTLSVTGIPDIGQVVFGRRRQLRFEPNRPWDPTDLQTRLDRFESRAGVRTDVPRFRGRRRVAANLNPFDEPFQQDLIDWFTDINHGASPLVWVDTPNTGADDFYFMKIDEPSFEYPFVTFSTREMNLRASEQGPNFFSQDP